MYRRVDPKLLAAPAHLHADAAPPKWWPSATASAREQQDEYSLQSQQRTAAAQAAGLFADEIIPVTASVEMKTRPPARSATRT
jgi:acetyl-CoA C-acetyltransferase